VDAGRQDDHVAYADALYRIVGGEGFDQQGGCIGAG
jgi:hypothetical protein